MLCAEDIRKTFDATPVLRGVSLNVAEGEILCLLGPSGCGKTTLLRIIAGLEKPDSGSVKLDEVDLDGIPPYQRGFGLMFQDFALFPHLNVADNVAFGLQMSGLGRAAIRHRVGEVLNLVGMAAFGARSVNSLSGGEQQRVALARSLAPQPKLLMLDEPLGSLDAALRERLVVELRETLKQAGVTSLYVTHDQSEAFAIADQIAVMNDGQIEQIGTPEALYLHPQTVFTAQFLGVNNLLTPEQAEKWIGQAPSGNIVLLHPAYLELSNAADTPTMIVTGRIFRGSIHHISLHEPEDDLHLTLYIPSTAPHIPNVGEQVHVQIREGGVSILTRNSSPAGQETFQYNSRHDHPSFPS